MAWISLQNVTVHAGGEPIVRHATMALNAGDRVGLVGPNGMGKTSFLKVLSGEWSPTEGHVDRAADINAVRLEQWQPSQYDTLWDTVLHANPTLTELGARLFALESALADPATGPERLDALTNQWGDVSEAYSGLGGYEWEATVKAALHGVGFPPHRWSDRPASLSGGEKHRLALLGVILSGKSIWLLDEPTNHLDIVTVDWLENVIRAFSGVSVIVSHDRSFLDRVTTRTVSWEDGTFWATSGNWRQYQALRRERQKQEAERYQKFLQEERRLQGYIDRWRSGTRARQAQSRAKALDRLRDGQPHRQPSKSSAPLDLIHRGSSRPGALPALVLDRLQLARGVRQWQPISAKIAHGTRIAVVGPNGTGKTTLLEALVNGAPGVTWHPGLEVAYLPQTAVADLPHGVNGMAYAHNLGMEREEIFYFGSRFGLSADLWQRDLDQWSGGERTRLKLLEILTRPSQVLVLDEPTNHLDIAMREAAERLLASYPGTIIVASHDRAMLETISQQTVWATGDRFIWTRQPYRAGQPMPSHPS